MDRIEPLLGGWPAEEVEDGFEEEIGALARPGLPGSGRGVKKVVVDERRPALGVARALALHLFEAHQISLAQAAKLATLSLEDFLDLLGQAGIPAVDYDPADLSQEIEIPAAMP